MSQCGKHRDRWVPWFAGFTEFTPTIPKMYWDVESQEQRIHAICKQLHKLVCYADMLGDKINLNREDIDELQRLFEQFMESGFDDYYADQVEKWIDEHMLYIYAHTIGQVFFSLDDSGYLIAHVPVGWDQIMFSTPLDYSDQTSYGRLCLTYGFDTDLTYNYDEYMEA